MVNKTFNLLFLLLILLVSNSVYAATTNLKGKKNALATVRLVKENLTIKADFLKWIDKGRLGNDVDKWPDHRKKELIRRYRQTQTDKYVPWERVKGLNGPGFDSEVQEAYLKIRTGIVIKIGEALTQIGGLVTLIGSGPKDLAVEAVKMIADALGKSDEVTVENAPELLKKYVDDFDKLDHSKKVSVLWKIESKLTTEISIEVKMEAAKKKGAQAQSRSDNSISFDAGTQILSFSDDFITGLDNAMHSDPNLIGANVYIPSYTFQGYTTWGEPYPFFTQEVNDEVLKISTSSLNYMRAEMPSLVYMGDTNTFYGIMPFMLQEDSGSSFVADLQDMFSDSWDLDMTSYLTMQITPDIDFFADTNSFTEDSRPDIGFTNSIGMRVSEPSSILLVLMGFSGIALFPKWRIEFKS